ncbi:hypothetical protein GSI_14609 [Ganoderma sinense ZZ0214-1]|uniref:DUF7918 domain-containing protein n=1 Tax=Ganoderma sinense ZZ0214-1 TaxID=1077348 RepID=A0A2G8RP60_9APHY|nr:hypothetical protein GSI_14609 [Ganoderma sinense ZZ0214-1]
MGKFRPVGAVNERSKKAGVHCVSLGANRQVPLSKTQSSSTPLNPREGNVAKFIFRYRPRGLLQAQGIIPLPAAERKPIRLDRKIKKRPSDEVDRLDDISSSRPSKRSRRTHDLEEEDVKPSILKIDMSLEEDVKPVLKTCSSDEEEEELVEADIVKVDPSDDEEEAELEALAELEELAEHAKEVKKAKEEVVEEKEEEEEEDLELLQSQIQVLQEKFAKAVKRKATGGSQTSSVKAEPGPASQLSGVVIDLTLDDDDD